MAELRFGLGAPYIDVDEWREQPRRHRYVHGGFENSDTRFSFYFPPAEFYSGRCLNYLEGGMGGHEHTIGSWMAGDWLFDLAFDELGGYLIESNQGHFPAPGHGFLNDLENWGASAESAKFSWEVAREMYGTAPHHSYVWGVSGGGGRTMSCIENGPDVWDGAAPHMCYSGSNHASWSAEGYWWLLARHKLADVVDALNPGGSGDPFATLTFQERDGLAAVLRHGYPRPGVSQLWQFAPWVWQLLMQAEVNPYFQDFWNKPGYKGHDSRDELTSFLIDYDATVDKVLKTSEMPVDTIAARIASAGAVSDETSAITIDKYPADRTQLFGAKITITSGKAKGRAVPCSQVEDGLMLTSVESNADLFDGVQPGDDVHIDNYDFIAWCHMFLHQLDLPQDGEPELPVEWGGLKAWTVDGIPLHPQLPRIDAGARGHTGNFSGKVIHVNTSHDSMVWPNGAIGWTHKIEDAQGEQRHDRYRLWWCENSPHGDPTFLSAVTAQKDSNKWLAEMVTYNGFTAQALRELIRWVEDGVEPSPNTKYHFTDDGGLVLPPTAEERGGVQPLGWAMANGGACAEVKVGEPVRFEGIAQQPPGMGSIVWTEWDFDGTGVPDLHEDASGDAEKVTVEATHSYNQPGTYFVGFRVAGHRDGSKGLGLPVENIARVRVVVS
jgi:hypothetical protein